MTGVFVVIAFLIIGSQADLFSIGTSTLSLSEVDLRSSTPFFSGKAWLLTFVPGTTAQSYFGDFDATDVSQKNDGPETTENDFTIEVEYEDTECVYDFQGTSSNTPIYELITEDWIWKPWDTCTETEAESRGMSNVLYVGGLSNLLRCGAIGYNELSPIANIDSPDVESEFTVTIDVEGEGRQSAIFNTLSGQQNGYVGSFAYLTWQGNLVSGQSCPDKDPFKAAYINGIWRIISESRYDDYEDSFNGLDDLLGGNTDLSQMEQRVNNVNSRATTAKGSKSFGTIFNSNSISSGRTEVTTQTPIQFPLTTMYIKSATLGIFTPTPDINFVGTPDSDCFKTGSGNGLISVTLKNTGDEGGGFTVGATCDAPFEATNVQGSLGSGEQRTYNLPLTATGSQQLTANCEVFVSDITGTQRRDVSVCVDPEITCTVPYPKKFCGVSQGKDVVKQCSQDGATSEILETCNVDFFCEEGQCKEGPGGGGGGIFDRFFGWISDLFNGGLSTLFMMKRLILLALGAISVFSSETLLKRVTGLKKNKAARWLIAIGLGIGVSLILNNFIGSGTFWVLVALAVVYVYFGGRFKAVRKFTRRKNGRK